jgi:hypothetical protein
MPESSILKSSQQRAIKSPDIGGTSDAWDIPYIVEFAKIINPARVLDIGTGNFGKIGYILRQYVEHKYRKYYHPMYMNIVGLEAYIPNFDYVSKLGIYDELYNVEALSYLSNPKLAASELVVCTHVLEHHTETDGWKLLMLMRSVASKAIILACPDGEYEHIDMNNYYQNHRSAWTPDKIASVYPITTPVFGYNNTGHKEFVIVIPT